MQVDIRARGFQLTDSLQEYIERRLQFTLAWTDDQVRKVTVRLFDLNGPRGGDDKRCRIQITFSGLPDVVIEDTEADLYVAIDRAADRAKRTVARRLEKQRDHRHDALPGPEAETAG